MAAGQGFKTWNTGDVLSANDVNGYLMQGIWVFDDASDRSTQVTAPAEGNFSYLKDTNKLYYYTGSAWAEADTSGILPSEFAAKGDLLVGTGSGTFDNLGVGANDTVLTADSSTATGLKWASVAAGGGGFTQLASGSLSGSALNLTSISQSYENLRLILRDWYPATNTNGPTLKFENNSSDVYRYISIRSTNATPSARSGTFVYLDDAISGYLNSDNSNVIIIDVLDYADAGTMKIFEAYIAGKDQNSVFSIIQMSGIFAVVTAIDEINIGMTAGNFGGGTYELFGVK